MPTIDIGDAEIYYDTYGTGTPLLLVPGLGGVGSYWTPNISALAEQYQVIIHDHRGAGKSSHSPIRYSVDQMTADLVALMDHLKLDKVHLVGHSTGGAIGQTLAVIQPHRLKSMVIYASWTRNDPYFARVFEARRTLLTSAGPAAYVRSAPIFLYPDWWINENLALLEEREKTTIPACPPVDIVASRIDAILDFDRTADLPGIAVPSMILCAKDDILTPPYFSRELARLIPGSELVELDRGGHCASETNTLPFNAAVLDFIARHD
jgi:aminoacrylate hydrolase